MRFESICGTTDIVVEKKNKYKYKRLLSLIYNIFLHSKISFQILKLVYPTFQHKCYIVATSDVELKRRIRKIPGVPIMGVAQSRLVHFN